MPRKSISTPSHIPVSIPPTMTTMDVDQHRVKIYGFTPNDSVAGRHHLNRIDRFYIKCQKHRDFYKDMSGRLQPQYFTRNKQFATRPDPTSIYLKIPTSPYEEHKPVAYPLTMGRRGLNSLRSRFG